MYSDSSLTLLFYLQFALFVLPTIVALIWAAVHHWDLPNELEHPVAG